ncbi:MAG: FlgD immunoglobulin-like domain containing protein [Elusimicrobiota bacterium]
MNMLIHRAKHALAWLCLAACLLAPAEAGAIPFRADSGVILSSTTGNAVQAILPKSGGQYRMYFTSGSYQILSATSNDLFSWTLEAGVRLSTDPANDVDYSSITSCGIYVSTNTSDYMRMYYVGISSLGLYRILSATSTDGLAWSKTVSTHIISNNGLGFLDSPRPFPESSGLIRLYYAADKDGGNTRSSYRIHTASSSNDIDFNTDGPLLASEIAYQVSVTSLTDGRTRLYYTSPLTGETTGSQILSVIASSGSQSFSVETSSIRFSTASGTAALSYPVVVRSTESWRWRMFYSYGVNGATNTAVASAFSSSPTLSAFTPGSVQSGNAGFDFTITGEMFSDPPPTISLYTTGDSTGAVTLTRNSDLSLSGTMSMVGKKTGFWTLQVMNSDYVIAALANVLNVTLPPAEITLVDNLLRPLNGGQTTISIKTYEAGRVSVRLYSQNGELIRTLVDEDLPSGLSSVNWDGRTLSGYVVSSGVYLVNIQATGTNVTRKIVIIK